MEKEKREQDKHKNKSKITRGKNGLICSMEDILCQKALFLGLLSLLISFLITPSFTMESPPYRLGDVADQNIKAGQNLRVEDKETTLKKREEAVRQAPLVYDLDESVAKNAQERLETAFQTMREYLKADNSSSENQAMVPEQALDNFSSSMDSSSLVLKHFRHSSFAFPGKKDFEVLVGFPVPDEIFSNLVDSRFDRSLQDKMSRLLESTFEGGIVANKASLLQAQGERIVIRKTGTMEEYLTSPSHPFPDLEEVRKMTRMEALELGRDVKEMVAIAFLATQLLKPNLTFNPEETGNRREQAYAAVEPVYIQLMKNEMLVREGQKIGPQELLKLEAQAQTRPGRHQLLMIFITMFLFSGLCIWVVTNVTHRHIPSFRMEFHDLLFLGTLLIFLLTLGRSTMWIADMVGDGASHLSGKTLLYAIPLTTGAMMTSIFFGVTVSLIFSLLLTLFAGMLFGKDFGLFFFFLIGSFVAAHGVTPCRNRMIPIKAGLLVGITNVFLIVLTAFIHDQLLFFKILSNAFFAFCSGLFSGILVTGLTPLVEMLFGYTTDIKLLELATMDQPLLQELMVQAPGTYHHSIIVGNMVEAAAKSIGANSLLAKVAAYYHDIGKIKKPLYFIENQFDCENRHEKLAPSMSSLILISHVKEGVELAKQHRLGKAIIDIISQHHGKSFISFFYQKALDAREKAQNSKGAELPPINMDDYRYPGPKPQTKEAGLVMLGDVVEAACRSLTDPTPARIQGLVNRLINNIFSDGQLEECELTLKDLHQIAKHFNQILATVHHKRIEYPSAPCNDSKGKTDASDSNQRESKPDRDKPGTPREKSRTDLKRLGIH
ncbi:HD family phosphohydrolase [Desulforhabdus amnigena]|jgi:putative nucleotidyltransferase with HDIG domain|uniref:HD family phosphohydrolase n=1 Tax=Desulforhabdus amnigena TaxID=40218 RepID=A0A9W6L9B2_9BACT|nr:HDIG domain-containing metalloprotein [Desulforhabdus amnigena]NLJ27590.1 HDIG domain-containing protein [Deltaproteobacteria bacterium]GLI35115.1 HD family phosphohydrolase [Desulforhabdus amnigena]